jgi:ABC-type sugar transport system ATPase subunit
MIEISGLDVALGDFTLTGINLAVKEGEYFIILGPTGAGKTVLLESIAGLNTVKKGRILIEGRDVTDLKPEQRRVGIVYQDHALFPHLSVRDNILFGLKLRKTSALEMQAALDWLAELLHIGHLLKRKPVTLSGGEKQKVALARALSNRPPVLLLDEPLSALDPASSESVQEELSKLHQTLNNTIIHVTHNFEEAMALGTHVAVIGEGSVKQVGTPEQIFRKPESTFVARFSLARNIFAGEIKHKSNGESVFHTPVFDLKVAGSVEGTCFAAIRAEDVQVSRQSFPAEFANAFFGAVTAIIDRGTQVSVTIAAPAEIRSLISRQQYQAMGLKIGDRVSIFLDPVLVHVFQE